MRCERCPISKIPRENRSWPFATLTDAPKPSCTGDLLPRRTGALNSVMWWRSCIERNQDPLTKYKVFEAGVQGELEPVEIEEAKSDQVIDQEKNVARLRTLLTAFVKGSHMPFTLLEGEGGVGKTLSLQALVREIDGLKLVLISSDHLGQIREYARRMAEGPWRTVLYIDDMTFDPRHFESFKIGTQGMKRFYDNVTVMALRTRRHWRISHRRSCDDGRSGLSMGDQIWQKM